MNAFESACQHLLGSGAGNLRHSGRTLYDHLLGTERLLRSWGCCDTLCKAGLYHSIYSTNRFRDALQPISARADIVGLIGADAERLVYLFSIARRPSAWLYAKDTGTIESRFSMELTYVSDAEHSSLVVIECANLIEQSASKPANLMLIQNVMDEGSCILQPEMTDALRSAAVSLHLLVDHAS